MFGKNIVFEKEGKEIGTYIKWNIKKIEQLNTIQLSIN